MDLLTLQVCSDIKMSLKWKLQWIMQKLLCLHYSTMQDGVSALPRPQFKRENKQLSGFFDILILVAFGVISSCLKFQPNAQEPASTHSDFSFVPITWWVVRFINGDLLFVPVEKMHGSMMSLCKHKQIPTTWILSGTHTHIYRQIISVCLSFTLSSQDDSRAALEI